MDGVEERIETARRAGATSLDLSGLGLTTLPASMRTLTGLTELFVYGNRFAALPAPLRDLTALARLSLAGNQLNELPEWLGELTALTWLNVADNRLTALPQSLGRLTVLTDLNLARNHLAGLPESLSNLTVLTRLDLAGNELAVLPQTLGGLTALTRLDLAGNRLAVLPAWLREPTAHENPAPDPLQVWVDGVSVADPDDLDAAFDLGSPGVALVSEDGRRTLYLTLEGAESWLSWEDDHDVLLSWGPVPPGAPAGQVIGDYVDALSDPWFTPEGGDEPPGVSEELARQAGHEFRRTGQRPRCVQWVEQP